MSRISRLLLILLVSAASIPSLPSIGLLHAQTSEFDEVLKKGKDELTAVREQPASPDPMDSVKIAARYQQAIKLLERAVALQPRSQEAQYFLGSAYDYQRMSQAPDGNDIRNFPSHCESPCRRRSARNSESRARADAP